MQVKKNYEVCECIIICLTITIRLLNLNIISSQLSDHIYDTDF
jgi:hypothetical protein